MFHFGGKEKREKVIKNHRTKYQQRKEGNRTRFLPYIADGSGLAEKLMEILQACPTDMQRDVITSLPEILQDTQHELVADQLKEILNETRELTCTVLDALASMNISRTVSKELIDIVLKRLYRTQDKSPAPSPLILPPVKLRNGSELSLTWDGPPRNFGSVTVIFPTTNSLMNKEWDWGCLLDAIDST